MELTGQVIRQAKEKSRAFSQITLDDDYIVKDNKPDVGKVIHTAGTIAIEETRLAGESLWVTGKLRFWVLYQGDGEQARLESLEGAIPFQEKMVLEGAGDTDPYVLTGDMEDLTVGIINSRKLSVRAVAGFSAAADEMAEEEIAGSAGEDGEILQKQTECRVADLLAAGKDMIRHHSEIVLPGAKPEIGKLLWYETNLRGAEGKIADGRIVVSGDLYISVVYLGGDDMEIAWLEKIIPFEEEVDPAVETGEEPLILWFRARPEIVEVYPGEDSDRESRLLSIDASYAVCYKIWRERTIAVIEDAYAVDRKVEVLRKPCSTKRFLMQNELTLRKKETIALAPEEEKILQLIGCTGTIVIDRSAVTETGVRFEGILTVGVLYLTSSDSSPVAYTESILPFDETAEIAGIEPTTSYVYNSSVSRLEVSLLDGSEYEVKAVLSVAVTAFAGRTFEKITSLSEEPLATEELAALPGITGIITGEGDDLWDIAKRCRTTPDAIRTGNNLSPAADVLPPGTKLIVVKQMVER